MFQNKMKRLTAIAVAMLLLCICTIANADVPPLSDRLFDCAKGAIGALAAGQYDRLVTSMPFSDISPSADEWQSFAQGAFSSLSGSDPQTYYAVAYRIGSFWKIAVPVSEPSNDGVEALVLVSEDGSTISGYARSTWGSIRSEYESSDYVKWNHEYVSSTSAVIEADVD